MSALRRTRIEDYLTAIEQICEENGSERAATGGISKLLSVSNGTASSMLKHLAEKGFVDLLAYEGASLSEQGRLRARQVLRKRRLIELHLSTSLGVPWESVADEAWLLEPAFSDRMIELIDHRLGHPEFDPHGDPIPHADGTLPVSELVPLHSCRPGASVVLRRVKNQSESVLRFLRDAGWGLGASLLVRENNLVSGVIILETATGQKTLGYTIAEHLFVRESLAIASE